MSLVVINTVFNFTPSYLNGLKRPTLNDFFEKINKVDKEIQFTRK